MGIMQKELVNSWWTKSLLLMVYLFLQIESHIEMRNASLVQSILPASLKGNPGTIDHSKENSFASVPSRISRQRSLTKKSHGPTKNINNVLDWIVFRCIPLPLVLHLSSEAQAEIIIIGMRSWGRKKRSLWYIINRVLNMMLDVRSLIIRGTRYRSMIPNCMRTYLHIEHDMIWYSSCSQVYNFNSDAACENRKTIRSFLTLELCIYSTHRVYWML